jgi:hypothetical protein
MTVYKFGVFQLTFVPSSDYADVNDVFTAIDAEELSPSIEMTDYLREIYGLTKETGPIAWVGQFRKFRTSDLPHIGEPGGEDEELEIGEKGLIERNYFMFIPSKNVLIWQANRHASSPKQFAQFIGAITGTKTQYEPFLEPDAMKRIMNNDLVFKKIRLRVARPKDPAYYPPSKWSQKVLDLLAKGGGDSLYIEASLDGRKSEQDQTEVNKKWRRALREFTKDKLATTAEAIVIDDGVEHPIDLLADRIESDQDVDFPGRYAPKVLMVGALKAVWVEVRGKVNEVLGDGDQALHL